MRTEGVGFAVGGTVSSASEPATGALIITGFGLVGAAARRHGYATA